MLEDLIAAKKYVTVAHHVEGRIRLKVDPSVVKDPVSKKLEQISSSLPGVLDTRVNIMARSVVIRYDPNIIDPTTFEKLITTKDTEACREILKRYEDTYMQS
ncbi:cation transporter [Geovibrio thiophilus]|uniref:Cation transporter n=1 Tax=Geovibrio thiophilus TaxID=139438 RepID=A0A3R6AXP8_9BACT|nr:cation transporter [Geovibrio thiophilus]QAR32905.1 cation transporter [Geovibrio thiophilus]